TSQMLDWRNVNVRPDATPAFPKEAGPSHYYAARHTDAAPLQVGPQQEKFLFYRGVGSFPLPISAIVAADHNILVKNADSTPIRGLILFENRNERLRYGVVDSVSNQVTLDTLSLKENITGLEADLESILVGQGLYEKEAKAMIETWRDSWFEEGTRLF